MPRQRRLMLGIACTAAFFSAAPAFAQSKGPTAETALKLRPIQSDVDYDLPASDEQARCTIQAAKSGEDKGWVVNNPVGQTLRRFVDTNGDNVVDQWCYYQNGLEVYRDIDSNFNGKADQYRWLNTSGSRWGLDENEDGKIDDWKHISAEEVTSEAVLAMANRDADRFVRLLPTAKELKSLGLGDEQTKSLTEKIQQAAKDFDADIRKQKVVTNTTKWLHFGGTRPGVVPEGTNGSTKDVSVYENVVAVVDTDGRHGQVLVGTIIKVGDGWRIVDVPMAVGDGAQEMPDRSFFFSATPATRADLPSQNNNAPSQQMQALLKELEELDTASPDQQAKSNARRADILEELTELAASDADKAEWIRQLADTVSAAVQSGTYDEGVERLKGLYERLEKDEKFKELAAHAKYVYLTAQYVQSLQNPKANYAKIQDTWLKNLEEFTEEYPKSDDTPEAMLQLAMAQEFAGEEEDAKKWYTKIIVDFPTSPAANKSRGAKTRIDSVGKTIRLQANDLRGKAVDVADFKGKTVLVHYWASWSGPCQEDLAELKELHSKYARDGLILISISLDRDKEDLYNFLKENRLPWIQIYESGGLDSRLANEMGILTLPTMILLDDKGKVVDRNVHISQLETELKTRLK